jgi:hypothetical protein
MLTSLDETLNFLRDFHAPALENVQGLEVDDASIPIALRKVYATFGDPETELGPISGQDSLAGPAGLKRVGDYVHFLDEAQACWSCAYPIDGGADPPVYLFGDDDKAPVKQSDSLAKFLVTVLLQESVLAAPHMAYQEHGGSAEAALLTSVEPLWLEAIYAQPNPTHWFYWSSEPRILLMRLDGDHAPWLWLGAYEDRWKSVLRECKDGYVVSEPSKEERRACCSNPEDFRKKRLPKWLRWLE